MYKLHQSFAKINKISLFQHIKSSDKKLFVTVKGDLFPR